MRAGVPGASRPSRAREAKEKVRNSTSHNANVRTTHATSPRRTLIQSFESPVRRVRVVRALSTVPGPDGPRSPTPAYSCVLAM